MINNKNIVAKATVRNLRVTPQKLGLVAELIRRRTVDDAIVQLQFSKKRIARDVLKCLKSACANAESKVELNDVLKIDEVLVGKSISMKRFHARARGRANQICKFFSHLTITLISDVELKKKETVVTEQVADEPVVAKEAKVKKAPKHDVKDMKKDIKSQNVKDNKKTSTTRRVFSSSGQK